MRKQIKAVSEGTEGSVKMPTSTRKFLNKRLQENFSKKYHPSIPLKEIFELLRGAGVIVVQEDGTEWSGFLTGDKGKANFELQLVDEVSGEKKPIKDCMLVMSWYKMPSGSWEINCYLS